MVLDVFLVSSRFLADMQLWCLLVFSMIRTRCFDKARLVPTPINMLSCSSYGRLDVVRAVAFLF